MLTNGSILLVDDDRDDLDFLQEAMEAIGAPHPIITATDGAAAMERLFELDTLGALPALIILDINMPRMDGKQTVAAIKRNNRLSSIPIVVYSTSSSERDKLYFSYFGVEMVTKPSKYDALPAIAGQLLKYSRQCV